MCMLQKIKNLIGGISDTNVWSSGVEYSGEVISRLVN